MSRRHGWSVKVKKDAILIERYDIGKRDDRQTMTIALQDWPTTTSVWHPNLADAQRAALWQVLTAMVERVFVNDDTTRSEVIIQITRDCDDIRGKIRKLVADDSPGLDPDEDGLIILRKSALRDFVAEVDAMRAELEALRKTVEAK